MKIPDYRPDYRPDTKRALPPPHERKLMPWPETIREAIAANERWGLYDPSPRRVARLERLKSLLDAAQKIGQPEI